MISNLSRALWSDLSINFFGFFIVMWWAWALDDLSARPKQILLKPARSKPKNFKKRRLEPAQSPKKILEARPRYPKFLSILQLNKTILGILKLGVQKFLVATTYMNVENIDRKLKFGHSQNRKTKIRFGICKGSIPAQAQNVNTQGWPSQKCWYLRPPETQKAWAHLKLKKLRLALH